jgi:hypothetical protein
MGKLIIYDHEPDEIVDLGDGSYYRNTNVQRYFDEESGLYRWQADAELKYWPVPIPVPEEIWTWRLRIAVKFAGLKDAVDSLLEQLPDSEGEIAREVWSGGGKIRRDSPMVAQLATALGLSSGDVDDLFIQAAQIDV